MESVVVPKNVFSKILTDVETLIDDVEIALNDKVRKRIADVIANPSSGKTEKELDTYLKKRGVKVD